MSKKILFVFGTRPEVIKMAPVIAQAKKLKGKLRPLVCVTAQHRYLLDQALAEFRIKPDIDLDLMRPSQSLYSIISRVSQSMRDIYRKVKPDLVLLQGDTSTVFAAALAAYYENIAVGHIEAGLRSADNYNPFPEEINRRFVSLVSKYNFCPTKEAKQNLLNEGVNAKTIFLTGNTVVDALLEMLKQVKKRKPEIQGASAEFLKRPYVLITGHRRENFSGGMKNICLSIKGLAGKYRDLHWLWAVHLNPNARGIVFKTLSNLSNVRIIEPPGYSGFVYLMDRCKFIISDSGGVQEEAPTLKKTVLVTRVCTERPEAVKSGTSILVGTSSKKITQSVNKLLNTKQADPEKGNPFGDGRSAKRIIDAIIKGS
ncbi:non-hydrolyzing UDP-N-acetylglucosamine 2-epimerase [Candidatus Omnitrophota bacterium]